MRARIAESFTRSLAKLEGAERAAVKRAAFDFLLGPRSPGLHLHRLVHSEDHRFWSLRVNRDLRVIVHRGAEELVLCWADHHDQAYAWAAHRTAVPGPASEPAAQVELPTGRAATPAGARDPLPVAAAAVPVPRARPGPGAMALEPGETCPALPRRLRVWRRAAGPLAPSTGEALPGAAPAPLLHLLRFFHEAEASAPAGAGGTPRGPGAGGGAPREAGAGASSRIPLVERLGAALARRASRRAGEAHAEVARLAAALDQLRRGQRTTPPTLQPGGEAGRAWAAIQVLERFLALEAGDIRRLVDAGGTSGGPRAGGRPGGPSGPPGQATG